jgi:hypothetical protein
MQGTKLKHLNKDDLLSKWQKEQIKLGYHNPQFFHKPDEIDPWKLGQMETQIVKEHIPALKNTNFMFSANRRNNKEMNQILKNNKIIKSHQHFHQK